MLRYSKLLLALAIGFVGTGGCSSRGGEDSLPGETVNKARLQLAGTGISAEIAVYPGGNNFSSSVVVTNTGTAATTNWEVDIQLNNATVVGAPWNCTSTRSGTVLTLRSDGNNSALAPGGTAWPGLNGTWTTTPHVNPTVIAVRRDVGMSGTGGASSGGAGGSAGKSGSGGISTGGKATGGSGTGGKATGGSSTGGKATGGSSTGGEATGGVATGGSTTGGSATGGTTTGGTGTGGTLSGGTNSGGAAGSAGSGNATATSGGSGGSSGNNVAQSKTATASSSLSANPASFGNDASSTTSWCAATSALNEWWSVDLGADYALTGTEITWPQSGRVYQYFVSISTDGTNYSEVVNQRGNARTSQTQSDSFTAQGRYLRLQITGLATSPVTSACIGDFKAFGTPVVSSGGGGATGTGTSSGGTTLPGDGGATTGSGGAVASGSTTGAGGTATVQGGAPATGGSAGSGASGGTAANSEEFFIELPANLTPELITLASYGDGGGLVINDGTKLIGASTGYVNVSSLSTTNQTELGVGTEVHDLYSAADVFVRGSHVHGNVTTAGALVPSPQAASLIDGTTVQHANLAPIRRLSWRIGFTPGAAPVTVAESDPKSISPGAFGDINLGLNSHLTLSQPGIYIVNGSLTMEPGSVLTVANSAYHVELYVRGNFIYRGTLQKAASSSNFVIGVAGTGDIPIERPFDAILVAPHASVQLGTAASGHRTSIYAKSILARANSTITQAAFTPNSLCAEGEARVGLCAHNCAADGDCVSGLSCHNAVCGCTSNGSGACGVREPCTDASDCQPGLTCTYDAPSRYGVSWQGACMPVSCTKLGPGSAECVSANALCGACPVCANPHGCLPTTRASAAGDWLPVDGAVAGAFAVSDAGTATYSIPIPLPPGRGDMTPSLGLVYDSSGRQDLMGEGWQISGLSYITRCISPASPAGEQFRAYQKRRGIRGNDDDQLCLDGQQLARQPTLDGSDGSRGYTTANESFKRIRAYGGSGANAEYFQISTPEGRILTYGTPMGEAAAALPNAQNANVYMSLGRNSSSAVTRVWALSKVEDQVGNYIEYKYLKNEGGQGSAGIPDPASVCTATPTLCGTTEIWPIEILYTGFANFGGVIAPTRKVTFVYEPGQPRAEPVSGYVAGVQTSRSNILNSIDISINNVVVKTFRIENVLTSADVFEVKSISECIIEAPYGLKCLKPTEFWYFTGTGFEPATDAAVSLDPSKETPGESQFIVWDANGDGRDDLVTAENTVDGGRWIQLTAQEAADGSLTFAKSVLPYYQLRGANKLGFGLFRQFEQANIYDVDADGFDDLMDVSPRNQSSGEALKGWAAPGTTVQTSFAYPSRPPLEFPDLPAYQEQDKEVPKTLFADVDGDGLSDAVMHSHFDYQGKIQWRRNLGKGLFASPEFLPDEGTQYAKLFPLDMDGDGALDFVTQPDAETTTGRIVNWQGTPTVPFFQMDDGPDKVWLFGTVPQDVLPIDVNGDGLKDVIVRDAVSPFDPYGPTKLNLYTNTGKGLVKSTGGLDLSLRHQEFASLRVLDYDADGREDAIFWNGVKWVLLRGIEGNLVVTENPTLTTPGSFEYERAAYYWGDSSIVSEHYPWSVFADVNGDGAQDFVVVAANKQLKIHRGRTATTHMLRLVIDGHGQRTEVQYHSGKAGEVAYHRVADSEINQPTTRILNRVVRPLVKREMVSRQVFAGYVPDHGAEYDYTNARVDYAGRGWIGFDQRQVAHLDELGHATEWNDIDYGRSDEMIEPTVCLDGGCGGLPGPAIEPWRYPYAGVPTKIKTVRLPVTAEQSADGVRTLAKVVENDWEYGPRGYASTVSGRYGSLYLRGRKSIETDQPAAGGSIRTISEIDETFKHDSAGNVTQHEVWSFNSTTPVEHTIEESTYVAPTDDYGVRWLLRLPKTLKVTRTRGDSEATSIDDFTGEASSRSVEYGHDQFGQLTSITRRGTAPASVRSTSLHRNDFGNVDRIERSGTGAVTRVTAITKFDADNIYPEEVVVQPDAGSEVVEPGEPLPKPHQSTFLYDARFGQLSSDTDSNGLIETWEYDGFGRLARHHSPDGSGETMTYAGSTYDSSGVLPVPAVFKVTTTQDGGGQSTEEIDSLGRTVRTTSLSIGSVPEGGAPVNVTVVQEHSFDYSGRPYQSARPHVAGDRTQGVVTHSYNDIDELTSAELADGTSTTYDRVEVASMVSAEQARLGLGPQDAFVIYRQDPMGALETRVFDLAGQLTTSVAADGGRVTYEYDGFGNVRYIRGPNGTTERVYDQFGRLKSENDPDRGLHEYNYTAFDEVRGHFGPGLNGLALQTIDSLAYDSFGRLKRMATQDGVRRWQYDQGENAIGKISAEFVDIGGRVTVPNSTNYTYDTRGRLKSATQHVLDNDHVVSVDYTADGRVQVVNYPRVGDAEFKVESVYDPLSGMVSEVRDALQPANHYWKLEQTYQGYKPRLEQIGPVVGTMHVYDAKSGLPSLISSSVGATTIQSEGYGFNANHNLEWRQNHLRGMSQQTFKYDELNRLTDVFDEDGTTVESIRYDHAGTGNILSKTGIGDYNYVDATGLRPHAVKSTSLGRSYGYDDSGNQITRHGGSVGDQTLKYTRFGLPYEITTHMASTGRVTALEYGAGGQRITKQQYLLSIPEDPTSTRIPEAFKIYVGGLYELRAACAGVSDPTCANPAKTHIYRVYGGGREVAQVHREEGAGQSITAQRTYFLHSDQLGSPALITAGDDSTYAGAPAAGTVLKDQQFSPFGKATAYTAGAATVYTGFTGLEEDPDEGLINANGRMYDPELGRFLSPDPFSPFASWSQGQNPYTYSLNNPLNWVDRSGFEPTPGDSTSVSVGQVDGGGSTGDGKLPSYFRANDQSTWPDWYKKAHHGSGKGGSRGMRTHPTGGHKATGDSAASAIEKPHPDPAQAGSADGAKGTSPQPTTGATTQGGGNPGESVTDAVGNSGNPGKSPGSSVMDGATAVVGLLNLEPPAADGQGQSGGIPGGYCDGGSRCVSGPEVQVTWAAAMLFGSKLVNKAIGAWSVVKAGAAHAAAVAGKVVDTAAERVSALARRATPAGVCFVAGTPVQVADGAVPIESLQVGDRVVTIGHDSESNVSPDTWRHLHLTMPNPDGSGDLLELDTLRPITWIEETGAAPGQWIAFGLPEMGLFGDALVDWIGPIPPIQDGSGRVVLSTVTHFAGNILQLWLQQAETPLESTTTHRFFSADRGDWIPAKELQPGERLTTADGFVKVAEITPKNWLGRVYNIEVETEHSYLVGDAGVLSHNANPCGLSLGRSISEGHAFGKHVLKRGEFSGLGIKTQEEFAQHIDSVVSRAQGANARQLTRGRTAFWDDASGTVVIHDPGSPDLGTAFRPTTGRSYFEGLE